LLFLINTFERIEQADKFNRFSLTYFLFLPIKKPGPRFTRIVDIQKNIFDVE